MDTDPPSIRGGDVLACGVELGPAVKFALTATAGAAQAIGRDAALARLREVVSDPASAVADPHFGAFASEVVRRTGLAAELELAAFHERDEPAPFRSWCVNPEPGALQQMHNAMRIPSAVSGALMPDAHQGYGLPIGGVLATDGTVVPYAVGVDIACRMKLTVLDIGAEALDHDSDMLERALIKCTSFGIGVELDARDRPDHEVLDAGKWDAIKLTRQLREKASAQLGTSGSGNHFVEFGELAIGEGPDDLGLIPGRYLALMSHSGSRGSGAKIASHFTNIARAQHANLPPELSHLAWLDLQSEEGQAYWYAMSLMGEYASACHAVIHERVCDYLNASVIATIENHHNFAWIEQHGGREVVVHRKGATPAAEGVLGVIPGSMATPAFVVRGKGSQASLLSASHGAGRVMSRTVARQRFSWAEVQPALDAARVRLLAAGIDENPFVYKDIHEVMSQQTDLVDVIAQFDPRIVRMADAGERPED